MFRVKWNQTGPVQEARGTGRAHKQPGAYGGQNTMKHKIGILGAGTWGMALARMLTVSGNDVTVWSALEQEIDNLSTTRV